MQKQRLSQVFLHDHNILDKIINASSNQTSSNANTLIPPLPLGGGLRSRGGGHIPLQNPSQSKIQPPTSHLSTIVEIGSGEGILSARLAPLCKKLYIIEIDNYFLEKTKARLKDFDNVTYIHGDILKLGFPDEPKFKVIANIPYHISAKIIKLVIENKSRVQEAILMVQDEFAKKLISPPGHNDYSSLSVYTNYHLKTKYLFKISRNCFTPKPKVDSALISLIPRAKPPFEVDEEKFFAMVRSIFWGRRKSLVHCLAKSPYLKLNPAFKTDPYFIKNHNLRAENLDLDGFYELYKTLLIYTHSVL